MNFGAVKVRPPTNVNRRLIQEWGRICPLKKWAAFVMFICVPRRVLVVVRLPIFFRVRPRGQCLDR